VTLDSIFLNLHSIFLNHGVPMTGGGTVNGTHIPVTTFPTEGLMGFIETINSILSGILGIFGGGL